MSSPEAVQTRDPSLGSAEFLDELYARYLTDPRLVDPEYRAYFESVQEQRPSATLPGAAPSAVAEVRQIRLRELVEAYRKYGHRAASLDPLSGAPAARPELDFHRYGFTEQDLETDFDVDGLFGLQRAKLSQIVALLKETYCRFIGAEFTHIEVAEMQSWLAAQMEATRNRLTLSREDQLRMLERLTDAEVFERFLQMKFLTEKRFSLEGAESLIPLIDLVIERSAGLGAEDIVIGMAHRGRLNVLANVIGQPEADIFRKFLSLEEDGRVMLGRGDVKYHLGYSADYTTQAGKKVHLSLAFNPSHLEAIYPVLEGRVRARQDRMGDTLRERSLALVLHGDAAFAGQGVVAECLNYSDLDGYTTGGTIHVIVNNQVGFTTNPDEARSTLYATGIARMLDVPIFHVNGEEPESVAQVVRLAVEFRYRFKRDAVIDLYCYRKYGHNEGDEPRFTQPVMYQAIDSRQSVRESYVASLITAGLVTNEDAQKIETDRKLELEAHLATASASGGLKRNDKGDLWNRYHGGLERDSQDAHTGVDKSVLLDLAQKLVTLPADFEPLSKLVRGKGVLAQRQKMAAGTIPIDWGFAENLAFASLLLEGHRVRVSGQDSARGTFNQRHAVYYDARDGRPWSPLHHLAPNQAPFEVRNSPLSEYGVLGFDYGYSLDAPDALVCWEAQYGDFANGAQVIIDQYLSSAEDKWDRLCGMVVLLPHGFEGQGPEHSSARLERYLNMSAEDNWQVCNVTTAAQYFHVLRRQLVRPFRKPLILMTPKSLLKRDEAASTFDDLAGDFQRVIGDRTADPNRVRRALLCTGKVYYDLDERRRSKKIDDAAIIRVEQIYPFPSAQIKAELRRYPKLEKLVWVQEEPWNMGAWFFLRAHEHTDGGDLPLPLACVSRAESASPATGHRKAHEFEQEMLLDQALSPSAPSAEAQPPSPPSQDRLRNPRTTMPPRPLSERTPVAAASRDPGRPGGPPNGR
jgi:2-oxoglutarate dehydrogenase E1 component